MEGRATGEEGKKLIAWVISGKIQGHRSTSPEKEASNAQTRTPEQEIEIAGGRESGSGGGHGWELIQYIERKGSMGGAPPLPQPKPES